MLIFQCLFNLWWKIGCFIFWQVTADFPTTVLKKIIPEVSKDHRPRSSPFTLSRGLTQNWGSTMWWKQEKEKKLGRNNSNPHQQRKSVNQVIFFPKRSEKHCAVFPQEVHSSSAAFSVGLIWHLNDKVRQFEVHHIKQSNGSPRNKKEESMAVLLDALGLWYYFHKLNL